MFLVRHEKPDRGDTNCPDLHGRIAVVQSRLENIRLPSCVQRHTVRGLRDLRHLRGHELEVWILAFGPMVLGEFLPPEHYWHLLLLSSAVFWMTLEGAPRSELRHVEITLRHFHAALPRLYSLRALTYNSHQVCCHMLPSVMLAGPLHRQSAGLFETMHSRLRRRIHGSRRTDIELVGAVEREVAVIQADDFVKDGVRHPEPRGKRRTESLVIEGVLLRRPQGATDGWRTVSLPTGMTIVVFESAPTEGGAGRGRSTSSFVALRGPETTSFNFARVEALSVNQENRVMVSLVALPIEPQLDPLEALCAVSAASPDRGCRFAHVRRLMVDPFVDRLILGAAVRVPLADVVGVCVVSDTHIALMPHAQMGFS